MTLSFSGNNPVLNGNIQGPKKIWIVGAAFLFAGLLMGIILPYLITPRAEADFLLTQGKITDYAYDDEDSRAEIFTFQTLSGEVFTNRNNIWSSNPAYQINDQVEIYYDPNNIQNSFIKDDKNLATFNIIMIGLGVFFALLGLIMMLLKLRGVEDYLVERYMGLIGALSYGIPASLVFPVLYYFYQNRPNLFFEASVTEFPQESLIISIIFTFTGLITVITTLAMWRALQGKRDNTISIGKSF